MKFIKQLRPYLPPLAVLAILLGFSLLNSVYICGEVSRWQVQLRQADALAQSNRWEDASSTLADSYRDWQTRQTYLHIVSEHDAINDAEAMYRRAAAFAAVKEDSEFRAELADLIDQLRLLSEMEQCSIKNVL